MDALTEIATRASEAILRVAGFAGVRTKDDGSPVTAADEAAEAVIRDGLMRLAPSVPIVSEEQASHERPRPGGRGSYFLVDPLDGTKEFISGRDEYTVNIAIVTDGAPILGIVTAPTAGIAWRGIVGRGAERVPIAGGNIVPSAIHTRVCCGDELVVMVSRSHLEQRTKSFIEKFPRAKLVQCGFAAGHAIVVAAGGQVAAPDGSAVIYGSAELLVPAFLAWGDQAFAADARA
jgi:3'(2'), 5'-bisphosphate nucleotidase